MIRWTPVILGCAKPAVDTATLPRIGENVRLPDNGSEAVYRVDGVMHYVSHNGLPAHVDVHLQKVSR